MRAEDIVEELGLLLYEDGELGVGETLVRHGVAYDEQIRALLIGPFRAEEIRRDEPTIEDAAFAARLWIEGFIVGLRMARREQPPRPPDSL